MKETRLGAWLIQRTLLFTLFMLAGWGLAFLLAIHTFMPTLIKMSGGTLAERLGMSLLISSYGRAVILALNRLIWEPQK